METSIVVALISAISIVIVAMIPVVFKRKNLDQLAEEEYEETVASDGARSKKSRKRYK